MSNEHEDMTMEGLVGGNSVRISRFAVNGRTFTAKQVADMLFAEARAVEAETALFQEVRRNDEMKRQLAAAREALKWYKDQMCKYGREYEGCGKLGKKDCAGCVARAALAGG